MEKREGYKKTKLGWIPENWDCVNTQYLLKNKKGSIKIGPFGSQLKKSFFVKNGYKVYGQENVYAKDFQKGNRYIDYERFETLKTCMIEPGDFLISMMGTIGECSIVPKNIEVGIMDSHLLRLQVDNKKYSKTLLSHLFMSDLIKRQIKRLSVGGIMEGLSSAIVKSLYFPLPPLPEQKKIAEILTTVDNKISSIESQIQNTEQLKKGLMEKLLTEGIGHTEFKETKIGRIPESWKVMKLSEAATFRRGSFPQPYGLDEWYDDENGYPFVQVFDVGENMRLKNDTKRKISDAAAEKSVFVEKGTLLLTIQGSIGRMAIAHYDTYADRTLLIFQSFLNPTNIKFFMYIVHRLFNVEKQNAPGSTIKTITKERLSGFFVPFPPLSEQNQIASILSTVDDKLDVLQSKKTNYETLKKGLMEQLLTGERRVKL